MRIGNWDIDIIEESGLDTDANCKMIYNDYKAVIKLKKELSDSEKLKGLIHEMIHIIHRDELDIACDNLSEKAKNLYLRFHERSIEQMAKIIYETIK